MMREMCPSRRAPTSGEAHVEAGILLNEIQAAGTYVCNWNGFLLRVRADALASRHARKFNLVGNDPPFVTRISDDPDVPVSEARRIAAERSLKISF